MEILVFGTGGSRVLVFPTREGRFFDYENFGMLAASSEKIEHGELQFFCVDSLDSESFYCRHRTPAERVMRHKAYESYILEEVLPFTEWRNPDSPLITHGCSIGAYHAMTIALRHPRQFQRVVALSGRYDLTRPAGPFTDLLDGHYDDEVYYFTPNHFLPQLEDRHLLGQMRRLKVTLAIGEQDPFLQSTRELQHSLESKGIPHTMAVWEGEAHRPRYWQRMIRLYL